MNNSASWRWILLAWLTLIAYVVLVAILLGGPWFGYVVVGGMSMVFGVVMSEKLR